MDKRIVIIALLMVSMIGAASGQNIRVEMNAEIGLKTFKKLPSIKSNLGSNKQPIGGRDNVGELIERIYDGLKAQAKSDKSKMTVGQKAVYDWLCVHTNAKSGDPITIKGNAGLIFLSHQIDVQKLSLNEPTKLKALQEEKGNLEKSIGLLEHIIKFVEFQTIEDLGAQSESINVLFPNGFTSSGTGPESGPKKSNATDQGGGASLPGSSGGGVGNSGADPTPPEPEVTEEKFSDIDSEEEIDEKIKELAKEVKEGEADLKIVKTDSSKKKLEESIKNAKSDIEALKKRKEKIIEQRERLSLVTTRLTETIDFFKTKVLALREIKQHKEELGARMASLDAEIVKLNAEYLEKEEIISLVLGKFNKRTKVNDYMYHTKDIMVVVLEGEESLAKSTIGVQNKTGAFGRSLEELKDLSDKLEIFDNNESTQDEKLQLKFMILDESKIKPPTTILVSHESFDTLKFDIHEKVVAQIKVGFSGAEVDRQDLSIGGDDMDELTINVDEDSRTELKSNALAMIELYPLGRDLNNFESIFNRNNTVPIQQRFALVGGLRLSSDPLESIFGGIAFALDKEFSVNFGFTFQRKLVEGTFDIDPVDPADLSGALEYLRANAGREYTPKLFIGISLSPSGFANLIGL